MNKTPMAIEQQQKRGKRMSKFIRVGAWLAMGWAALPLPVQAASFDCVKASTNVEKMICADAELSRLDDEMVINYRAEISNSNNVKATRQIQQVWLKKRNQCREYECIKNIYQNRNLMMDDEGVNASKDDELIKNSKNRIQKRSVEQLNCRDSINPTVNAECLEQNVSRVEIELNNYFNNLKQVLKRAKDVDGHSTSLEGVLVSSQKYWTQYKNEICKLEGGAAILGNPNSGKLYFESEVACQIRLMSLRVEELKGILIKNQF